MSSGGYDTVHSPAMYQRYEPRRSVANFPVTYDRTFNHPPRRRSPSPGPPRRFSYDSYTPNRVELPHRNEPPHSYRPNVYRPDYSTGAYYDRPQSPDRYPHPSRAQDAEPWDRSNPWLGPVKTSSTWQDRKPLPPSPVRERPRRDDTMATRIFEPSDTWKRDHFDRPPRLDGPPTIDRYPNYRRDSSDVSPIRHSRISRAPIHLTGDRYRPPQEPYYGTRPEYDSYRPPYEDSRGSPTGREQIPTPVYRREAVAPAHGRNSDHYEPYHGRQLSSSNSVHGSASPATRFRSPTRHPRNYSPSRGHSIHSADESSYESELRQRSRFADPGDADSSRTKSLLSRPSSRSSIASTLHSEKREASPPRSAPPATPQAQSNSSHTIQASPEHPKSPSAHSVSPLHYPPDFRLINDAKGPTSPESEVKTECPIPFQAEAEVKLTGPAEDNDIILQDQSRMDLSPDQNDQTQSPLPQPPDVPGSLSTDPSLSVEIPVHPPVLHAETSAQITLTDAPSISLPPPSPLPTSQFDALKDQGERTSTREIQVVEISPRRDLGKTFVELPVGEDTTAPTSITFQSFERAADASISTPHVESTKRNIGKSAPAVPLHERAVPSSPSEEYSTKEALRIVVMTRLLCDRQTREERINPVLTANLALAPQADPITSEESDVEAVIQDVLTSPQFETRMQNIDRLRPSLIQYFSQRQANITGKIQHLQQEYVQLQESWVTHCHALNEQAKPSILEGETVPIGRTTRRSANLGDAVRSDLEMEQILASLESNDATDPNHLSQRNLATVPDMICVRNGKIDYIFDDTSHRVENPVEYYAACTGIHDWTEDEKKTFLDKYAAYPKQFGTIADWLPNKTSAQCVDYYYLHKKGLIDFRKVVSKLGPKRRRRGAGKRKGNALLTDIQKHDEEVHRDSGSPSVAQSQNNKSARGRKPKDKDSSETKPEGEKRGPGRPPSKRIAAPIHVEKTPTATPTPEPETKVRRRRIAASILSSTAPPSRTMSLTQDETEEDNPDPDPRPAKRAKRTRKIKSAATVEDEPTTPEAESTSLLDVSTPAMGKVSTPLSIQIPEQVKSASPFSALDLDSSAAHHNHETASFAPPQQDDTHISSLPSSAHQPNGVDTPGHRDPSPSIAPASPLPPPSQPTPPPAPPSIGTSSRVSPIHSDDESVSNTGHLPSPPRELSRAPPTSRPGKTVSRSRSSAKAGGKRPRISLGPKPTGRPGSPSLLLERIVQVVLPSPTPATAAPRKGQRKFA